MLHNYTVALQSKGKSRPRKYKAKAHDLSELLTRFRKTELCQHYNIKSIMRRKSA